MAKLITKPPQKICLFGGTFDPIHLGHIHIASMAVEKLGLDRVIFLPCQQSPHKPGQQHADARHRLAMCKLATHAFDWAEVDDHDLSILDANWGLKLADVEAQYQGSADLDGSGRIDLADFVEVRTATEAPGAPTPTPEPATLILMAAGLPALLRRRRSRG